MPNTYKTSEVARIIGIHPNTVRLYEELKLIPKPVRQQNGYRVFTDFHLEQFKLARTALRVEVLQNGLRKKAIDIIKTSATGNLEEAESLTENYNWELNGLLTVKRKQNGHRVYTDVDIRRLKIIRSLRCANYSLSAILRMLNELSRNPQANISEVIDTPRETDDISSVCDKLLTSLRFAKENAENMLILLNKMKNIQETNSPF